MTREEILKDYDVDSEGIIRSPGKFEGEPIYAPYFWSLFLEGVAYPDLGNVLYIRVMDVDREEFPELADVRRVAMAEDEQGIIFCEKMSKP